MLETARAEKVDEKNAAICLVSMFPSWFMVLRLTKKLVNKKAKSMKAIYIYASKCSHSTLSENDVVYRGLSHHS